MKGHTHWSAKQKEEAISAIKGGMSRKDVADATGIPVGTMSRWLTRSPATPKPILSKPPASYSLESFITGLEQLIHSYELLKVEREEFLRQADRWKATAFKLNQDIERLSCSK